MNEIEHVKSMQETCARIADRNDQSAWGIAREIRALSPLQGHSDLEALTLDEAFNLSAAVTLLVLLRDSLRWCAGSSDFNEGGSAEEGWNQKVVPILKLADEHIERCRRFMAKRVEK
jgi:hypothetical protein